MTGMDRQSTDWTCEASGDSAHSSPVASLADAAWVVTARRDRLLRTIEGEIIPRLMLAHAAGPAGTSANTRQPTEADIGRLCELALGNDAQAALRFVRGLITDGLSLEAA